MTQLRALANNARYAEAVALLDGADLASLDTEALYLAGVCFGSHDRPELGIELLKRAASAGFDAFWCAYHLGIFEARRGNNPAAAFYLTVALILKPERSEILPLLDRAAPACDLTLLEQAQTGTRSQAAARTAFKSAWSALRAGNPGVSAFYFTAASVLDPGDRNARERLADLAPDVLLTLLPSDASPPGPVASDASRSASAVTVARKLPSTRQLELLANSGKHREAASLLEGVDLDADLPPAFQYMAGVCLGAVGQAQRAVDLLKRAAAGGYPRFWCAYHLGLFEDKLGNAAKASYYYAAALILDPTRGDVRELLARVAPDADFTVLQRAQAQAPSPEAGREAASRGVELVHSGSLGAAAICFAASLALDPANREARSRLQGLAPDLSIKVMAGVDYDRLVAEIHQALDRPAGEDPDDLEHRLAAASRLHAIMPVTWHERGHAMIPALERLFRRALATPEVALDELCMLYDLLAFLYFYRAAHVSAMRGFADQVVKPFATAIRDRAEYIPVATPRPLGQGPLRIGYLSEFANTRPGNAIAPFIHWTLGGLARHFPDKYRCFLYAWSNHDDDFFVPLAALGIEFRRFDDYSVAATLAAVAEAVAADQIDILITDMHAPLPTVLFERRIAPVQIHHNMGGLPFWPLDNIDATFRIDVYNPELDGLDPDKCFPLGLGPWNLAALAPEIDPVRLARERARFRSGARLIGTYGRLAKITPQFMSVAAELAARHPEFVIALGGSGNGSWIREFIAAHGLSGRITLVEDYVDGHLWGHLLEVFLDTFPTEGGVSRREVMAKGRPVASMLGVWSACEAVPMLVARDPGAYVEIVSRLLTDPEFYEAACSATRELAVAGIGERDYAAALDDALAAIVRRVRGG